VSTVIPAHVSFKEDSGRCSRNVLDLYYHYLSKKNLDSNFFQLGFCVAWELLLVLAFSFLAKFLLQYGIFLHPSLILKRFSTLSPWKQMCEHTWILMYFLFIFMTTYTQSRLMMEMRYMLSHGAAESSVRLLRKYGLLDVLLPFQVSWAMSSRCYTSRFLAMTTSITVLLMFECYLCFRQHIYQLRRRVDQVTEIWCSWWVTLKLAMSCGKFGF
jgi:hypothetical protein